ncbi:hypothetical protein [Curtobacterium flaccumfaciens]|uniref:hypothetical protein n=1 Tax=Curtobacterium flaccumfaciens TaxID=2035 RepID=UPI003437C1EF
MHGLVGSSSPWKHDALCGILGEVSVPHGSTQGGSHVAKGASKPTQDNADALNALQDAAGQAAPSIDDVSEALKALTSPTLDARAAQRDLEAAIDAVSASVKDNGTSLDVTTEKGRANEAALDAIAQAAQNNAAALLQQTGSQDQATAAMESGRASLVGALGQYGVTGQAAQDYADKIIGTPKEWATTFGNNAPAAGQQINDLKNKILGIPAGKTVQIVAQTAAAQGQLDSFIRQNNGRVISVRQVLVQQAVAAGAAPGAAKAAYNRASGGPVYGPGTGTSDSIPAMLSNGEYVIREKSVRKYGTGILDRINSGHYANGGLVQKFASGGAVGAANARAAKARAAQLKRQQAVAKARAEARADAEAARLEKQTDIYQFRTSLRTGQLTGQSAVQAAFNIAQDSKFPERFRNAVARVADASEKKLLKLEKQSDRAADAVDKASDKLGDLRSASASMASGISGKLSDVSFGNYRSGSSLLRGLTSRAGKLRQFQSLLTTLQKNGLAPALLNEVASLGVDEGLPLAKSLASMGKGQLSAINSQYNAVGKTSTAIGGQVADANYKALITAAEKQLSAANANADQITKAISAESSKLQRLIGRALGVPGYSAGGYTGDGGASTVAGMVHGREFVVNQYATARNRGLLEAMNGGANVRYMDATRVVAAAPAPAAQFTQQLNVQPMQHVDPNTMLTVLGREAARQFAGMVQ